MYTLATFGPFLIGLPPACRDTATAAVVVDVALDAESAVWAMRPPVAIAIPFLPSSVWPSGDGGAGGENSNGSSSMELWDLERRTGAGGAAADNAFRFLLPVSLLGLFLREILLPPPAVGEPDIPSPATYTGRSIPRRVFSVALACLKHNHDNISKYDACRSVQVKLSHCPRSDKKRTVRVRWSW